MCSASRVVIGHDGAGIAHRAEILARIERIGRGRAEGADLLAFIAGQMRLRAILHHPELVLVRDRHDRVHVRRLSVQMHGNDPDGAWRDRGLDRRRIDRERSAIGIAEHHGGAGVRNHRRSADPGMRRGDHLVTRLDLQRGHREIQRIGAVGAGDAMLDVYGRSELPFEGIDVGPANESVVADDGGNRAVDLAFDGLILQLQIRKRHRHRVVFPTCPSAAGAPDCLHKSLTS